MHQVHRVVKEERLVLVPPDEIDGEVLDDIGGVRSVWEVQGLAILVELRFPVPSAGGIVGEVFVKAPVARLLAHLAPLAGLSRGIAGLLHELCDGVFIRRLRPWPAAAPRLIGYSAGAKRVT